MKGKREKKRENGNESTRQRTFPTDKNLNSISGQRKKEKKRILLERKVRRKVKRKGKKVKMFQ